MADEIVIGKIGLTPKGEYVSGELYDILDMVSHEGNSYVSKIENNGLDVTNTEAWLLAAKKGDKGDADLTAGDIAFNDTTTQLGEINVQGAIEGIAKKTSQSVDTIQDLIDYKGTATALIVKDILRGGMFIKSEEVLTADNGVIFNSADGHFWVRQFDKEDGLDVLWYDGTDDEKIQGAVNNSLLYNTYVYIGRTDSGKYDIEKAITIPSNTTIYIDGVKLKLTDSSRDNIFRSANAGEGITNTLENRLENITIKGINGATLEGADNPRATGDALKTLTNTFTSSGSRSYGSDAGVAGETQTGDWRNITILLACVDGIDISGLSIVNSHMYGMSMELCNDIDIYNITLDIPIQRVIDGVSYYVRNGDGINIRRKSNNFRITNIKGRSSDDGVALNTIPGSDYGPGELGRGYVSGNVLDPTGFDIVNGHISDISINSLSSHVRILNHGGAKINNIKIDNIKDGSDSLTTHGGACVIIGSNNANWGGVTPLGDTSSILINDVISNEIARAIRIEGSLANSTISNVVKNVSTISLYHPPISLTATALMSNVSFSNIVDVGNNTICQSGFYDFEGNIKYLFKENDDRIGVVVGDSKILFQEGNSGVVAHISDIPENIGELNNDVGYLQDNDLNGYVSDVQYDSSAHTITFYRHQEPNVVADLPGDFRDYGLASGVAGVWGVRDDFSEIDNSYITRQYGLNGSVFGIPDTNRPQGWLIKGVTTGRWSWMGVTDHGTIRIYATNSANVNDYVEIYHTGNFNPAQYVLQSVLNTMLGDYATKEYVNSPNRLIEALTNATQTELDEIKGLLGIV